MLREINVKKTIKSNRINFTKGKIDDFIYYSIIYFFGVVLFPFMSIRYEIINFKDSSKDPMGMFFSIFVPLLVSFFVAEIIYGRKKLIRLVDVNRNIIVKVTKELNWSIIRDETDYIIIEAGYYLYQISIIFDNNDILVHSLRYAPKDDDIFTFRRKQLDIFIEKVSEIKKRNIFYNLTNGVNRHKNQTPPNTH